MDKYAVAIHTGVSLNNGYRGWAPTAEGSTILFTASLSKRYDAENLDEVAIKAIWPMAAHENEPHPCCA